MWMSLWSQQTRGWARRSETKGCPSERSPHPSEFLVLFSCSAQASSSQVQIGYLGKGETTRFLPGGAWGVGGEWDPVCGCLFSLHVCSSVSFSNGIVSFLMSPTMGDDSSCWIPNCFQEVQDFSLIFDCISSCSKKSPEEGTVHMEWQRHISSLYRCLPLVPCLISGPWLEPSVLPFGLAISSGKPLTLTTSVSFTITYPARCFLSSRKVLPLVQKEDMNWTVRSG